MKITKKDIDFVGNERKNIIKNAKNALIDILNIFNNSIYNIVILTLYMHIFDRICCTCIPLHKPALMMAL
jgi:hypothetical protein